MKSKKSIVSILIAWMIFIASISIVYSDTALLKAHFLQTSTSQTFDAAADEDMTSQNQGQATGALSDNLAVIRQLINTEEVSAARDVSIICRDNGRISVRQNGPLSGLLLWFTTLLGLLLCFLQGDGPALNQAVFNHIAIVRFIHKKDGKKYI